MTELEYVFAFVIAYLALGLIHLWGATKMKKDMMRENHSHLETVQNFCASILRQRGGEEWEKFEPRMKSTLDITAESCHHNCDLNRNHHLQMRKFINQQLHLIYLLSEEKADPSFFDQLYFDDGQLRIRING